MMNQKKFSASDWKDSVDKDLLEIKKMLFKVAQFIDTFEQWRMLPFNKGGANESPNKKESRNTNTSNTGKGKPKGKNLRRKARVKNR